MRRNPLAPQSAQVSVGLPSINGADVTPDLPPTTTPAHPQPTGHHVSQVQPTPPPQATAPQCVALKTQESEREEFSQDDIRKSTYVTQNFKDRKFIGDIKQSIDMVLRDYNVCARQLKLSHRQKADYFSNILDGPARTFFFNNARDDMSFGEMASMMLKEFNSNSRQLQAQGTLEALRLDKFMAENNINTISEGLTKIVDLIE